jgi:hypothetical protein
MTNWPGAQDAFNRLILLSGLSQLVILSDRMERRISLLWEWTGRISVASQERTFYKQNRRQNRKERKNENSKGSGGFVFFGFIAWCSYVDGTGGRTKTGCPLLL